jgi:hypothetical protein
MSEAPAYIASPGSESGFTLLQDELFQGFAEELGAVDSDRWFPSGQQGVLGQASDTGQVFSGLADQANNQFATAKASLNTAANKVLLGLGLILGIVLVWEVIKLT